MTRGGAPGFSLIEVLVALAVFAVAATALLQAAATGVRAAGGFEDRAVASIVAENLAAELVLSPERLRLGLVEGETAMADRRWRWRRVAEETENSAFRQITIGVGRADAEQELATVILFRKAR